MQRRASYRRSASHSSLLTPTATRRARRRSRNHVRSTGLGPLSRKPPGTPQPNRTRRLSSSSTSSGGAPVGRATSAPDGGPTSASASPSGGGGAVSSSTSSSHTPRLIDASLFHLLASPPRQAGARRLSAPRVTGASGARDGEEPTGHFKAGLRPASARARVVPQTVPQKQRRLPSLAALREDMRFSASGGLGGTDGEQLKVVALNGHGNVISPSFALGKPPSFVFGNGRRGSGDEGEPKLNLPTIVDDESGSRLLSPDAVRSSPSASPREQAARRLSDSVASDMSVDAPMLASETMNPGLLKRALELAKDEDVTPPPPPALLHLAESFVLVDMDWEAEFRSLLDLPTMSPDLVQIRDSRMDAFADNFEQFVRRSMMSTLAFENSKDLPEDAVDEDGVVTRRSGMCMVELFPAEVSFARNDNPALIKRLVQARRAIRAFNVLQSASLTSSRYIQVPYTAVAMCRGRWAIVRAIRSAEALRKSVSSPALALVDRIRAANKSATPELEEEEEEEEEDGDELPPMSNGRRSPVSENRGMRLLMRRESTDSNGSLAESDVSMNEEDLVRFEEEVIAAARVSLPHLHPMGASQTESDGEGGGDGESEEEIPLCLVQSAASHLSVLPNGAALRPEFLLNFGKPEDARSAWRFLQERVLPVLADFIGEMCPRQEDAKRLANGTDKLSSTLHSYGVNMRDLGSVFVVMRDSALCSTPAHRLVACEMVVRATKRIFRRYAAHADVPGGVTALRQLMCALLARDASQASLGLLHHFWDEELPTQLTEQFGSFVWTGSETDLMRAKFQARDFFRESVGLLAMDGEQLCARLNVAFGVDDHAFSLAMMQLPPFETLEEADEKLKSRLRVVTRVYGVDAANAQVLTQLRLLVRLYSHWYAERKAYVVQQAEWAVPRLMQCLRQLKERGHLNVSPTDELASYTAVATFFDVSGNTEAAAEMCASAVEMFEESRMLVPTPQHTEAALDLAATLNNVAEAHHRNGLLEPAASLYELSLSIAVTYLGPNDLRTAACLGNLGLVIEEQERPALARPLFEDALNIVERALGPDDPSLVSYLMLLGGLLAKLDAPKEALAHFQRALAILQLAPSDADSDDDSSRGVEVENGNTGSTNGTKFTASMEMVEVLLMVGVVRRDLGEGRESVRALKRALSICETVAGPESPELVPILVEMAKSYRSCGKPKRASSLLKHAVDLQHGCVLGPSMYVDTLLLQGEFYDAAENLDAAFRAVRSALSVSKHQIGYEHVQTIRSLDALGMLYLKADNLKKARSVLKLAYKTAKDLFGEAHERTRMVNEHLEEVDQVMLKRPSRCVVM